MKIIFAGNPNVGKSTVFNALTGLKQHTGNWSGKTVELATGSFSINNQIIELQDLPGTYSLVSGSPEEEIARNSICFSGADLTLVVADATCLGRNLNLVLQILEITPRVALCVNLLDEAKRKGIQIDTDALSRRLKIPVIGISAKRRQDIHKLKAFLSSLAHHKFPLFSAPVVKYPSVLEDAVLDITNALKNIATANFSKRFLALKLLDNDLVADELLNSLNLTENQYSKIREAVTDIKHQLLLSGFSPIVIRDEIVGAIINSAMELEAITTCKNQKKSIDFDRKIDKILTSKIYGIPIMIGFFGVLLWITIVGANYPSSALIYFFNWLKPYLRVFLENLMLPEIICNITVDGIYQTTTWVISVMLPPMMIFFPLFTLLEDLGFLPRLAFNLDCFFKRAGSCGRQALTMCMGLGCNAVGVTGCRIISSKKERLAAMVTNCFVPCNGRFSMLISLSSIFIGSFFCAGMQSFIASFFMLMLIIIGVIFTLFITKLITTFGTNDTISFSLELPPFRRPELGKTLVRALFDRTIKILHRAIKVSAPAGIIIWLFANYRINDVSILTIVADFLDPFGKLLGMDGMIIIAFILALPANEIVLPILIMGYLSGSHITDTSNLETLKNLLIDNGWSTLTAINVMLFSLLHFPCATTIWTIKKESGSLKWTLLSVIIPTVTAILTCIIVTAIWKLIAVL